MTRTLPKALVAAATALTLTMGATTAAHAADVTLTRDGSSGFNFNSSGEGPGGNAHDNQVTSSRNGFTSSGKQGEEAEEAIAQRKRAERNKNLSSQLFNEDNPVQSLLVLGALAAIFVAGFQAAQGQMHLPR